MPFLKWPTYNAFVIIASNIEFDLFIPDIPNHVIPDISLSLAEHTRSLTSTATLLALQRIKDATL